MVIGAGAPANQFTRRIDVTRREQRLAFDPLVKRCKIYPGKLEQRIEIVIGKSADDHERQRGYFEDSTDWALKPDAIRRAMTDKALQVGRNKLATFVGRDEFEAAGGVIISDTA